MHPGANRVHSPAPGGANAKMHPVQRVRVHPGANPGKVHISTGLEPDWKFIFFSHDRSCCGEHIVHIDGVTGSSPVATTARTLVNQGFFHFFQGQIPQPYPNRLFVLALLNDFVRKGVFFISVDRHCRCICPREKIYCSCLLDELTPTVPQPIRGLHRMPASCWRCPGAWFRSRGRIYPA